MSKIDDLIMQLCPDGVEYIELGELLDYEQPTKYIVNTPKYDNSWEIPVLTAGQTFILGYTDETTGIFQSSKEKPVIIFDDFTTSFHWVDFDFKVKSSAMKLITARKDLKINFRFIYYAMRCIIYNPQDHARQWISVYSKFTIPFPPIEVQNEIVNILDTFTTLEAELEAELEARKKQYTFYRDSLLSFEGKDLEWKTLGEVASYSKNRISANQLNENNYIGVDNLLQDRRGKTCSSYVPTAGNLTEFIAGDVLIGNIRPYLKKIWHSNIRGGTNGDVLTLRINANHSNEFSSKFLYYLLASDKFFDFNMQFAKGAKMPRGDKDAILRFPIPYPSKSVQENVVKILDKFDVLVNDISIGLPAELAARRKQYEYYRNQLLTFNNVSNE